MEEELAVDMQDNLQCYCTLRVRYGCFLGRSRISRSAYSVYYSRSIPHHRGMSKSAVISPYPLSCPISPTYAHRIDWTFIPPVHLNPTVFLAQDGHSKDWPMCPTNTLVRPILLAPCRIG